MSDTIIDLAPDALFVVACPVCQGQIAATASLRGHGACCPLCASLFRVPFPRAEAPARQSLSQSPRQPQPAGTATGLGEDWGTVIEKLSPPRLERESSAPVDEVPIAAFEPPVAEPAPAEMAFREPVRTVRLGGEVIEIRRLSPEERRSRRFRRTLLTIAVGISILLAIVVLFGTRR
jgi:hypothetical protein